MAQFFGQTESSETRNGVQVTTFRVPALSKRLATRRAKMNSRMKGMSNFRVEDTEEVESADIPGQTIYDITVISER